MPRVSPIVIVLLLSASFGACGGGKGGGPAGSGGGGTSSGGLGGSGQPETGGTTGTGSGGVADTGGSGAGLGGAPGDTGSGGSIPDGSIFGDDASSADAGADVPLTPLALTATVDGQAEQFSESTTVAVTSSTVTINGARGGGIETLFISVAASEPITGPGGTYTCATGAARINYQKAASSDVYYLANMTLGSCEVAITALTAVSVGGTFSATLSTGGAEPNVVLANGVFSSPR
jgi:hypothetical protein